HDERSRYLPDTNHRQNSPRMVHCRITNIDGARPPGLTLPAMIILQPLENVESAHVQVCYPPDRHGPIFPRVVGHIFESFPTQKLLWIPCYKSGSLPRRVLWLSSRAPYRNNGTSYRPAPGLLCL